MSDSIVQQLNGTGSDAPEQLVPQSDLAKQVAKNPDIVRNFLSKLFGIKDAVRAYKGEMTEDEAQNFALTAALGVVPMAGELGPAARAVEDVAPEAAESITQMIRAYHGSPYDFDQFDLSKIGTGEGAQAYGHGLYFAENPKVAEQYKENLTPAPLQNMRIQFLNGKYKVFDDHGPLPGTFDTLEAAQKHWGGNPGRMYEVNIAADPEHFLDWDKPLSEQSLHVQKAIQKVLPDADTSQFLSSRGSNLYEELARRPIDPIFDLAEGKQTPFSISHEAATNDFRQAGILGIKYLDQGSRPSAQIQGQIDNLQRYIDEFAGDKHPAVVAARNDYISQQNALKDQLSKQTHNYVVFDPSIINIIKKYGLAGLIAAGATNFTPKQK